MSIQLAPAVSVTDENVVQAPPNSGQAPSGGKVTAPSQFESDVEGVTAERIPNPNQHEALELWGATISLVNNCLSSFMFGRHDKLAGLHSRISEICAVTWFSWNRLRN